MIAGTSSMRKTVLVIECGAALHCRARISIPVAIPQKTRQSDDTAVLRRKWRRLFSRPGPLWRLGRAFPQCQIGRRQRFTFSRTFSTIENARSIALPLPTVFPNSIGW